MRNPPYRSGLRGALRLHATVNMAVCRMYTHADLDPLKGRRRRVAKRAANVVIRRSRALTLRSKMGNGMGAGDRRRVLRAFLKIVG